MKPTKFLLSVLMAIVMMAMSPTKMWAEPMPYVASVTTSSGTEQYTDFASAVTAALNAESATIKMLADVEINSSLNVDKGNVTLDLNGKTITATAGLESPVLYLTAGSFSITDSSDDKKGEIKKNSPNLLKVTGGKLTISEGTFTANYFVLDISGEGTASLSGGKYMSTTSSPAIWNDSGKSILANGCAFYITGTNTELFDKAMGSIYTPTYAPASNITVMPGTIKATLTIGDVTTDYFDFMTAYNVAINSTSPVTMKMLADVNITPINSGNKLEMANGNVTIDLNSHKIYTTNGAIVLFLEGGSLTIDDSSEDKTGTMESSVNNALKVTGGSLRIHGGKLVSASYSALYVGNGVEDVKIDGGKFIANGYSSAIENYSGKSILVENYAFYNSEGNKDKELAENLNGSIQENGYNVLNITVKQATIKATLTIGSQPEKNYYDFKKAFDAALDADAATMKMLADVEINSSLNVNNGNVTLDLNGHTIHSVGPNTLNLSNGKLTIKDSSGDNSGTMSTSGSYALYVTGGTITIHGGTFSASGYALDITSPTVTATIDGGIFKATGGSGINNKSGKSILANGYAFCNSDGDELLEIKDDFIREGNFPAHYIIVKQATIKATLTIGSETKEYPNFNSAFNAALEADAAILKVMQDVDTYAGTAYENPWIVNKGNVILDLNGHTMYASQGYSVIKVTGGTLTILDSNEDKLGKMTTTGGSTIDATGGSITIKDGTFTTEQGRPFSLTGSATASLEGGRFISYSNVEAVVSGCGSPLAEGYSYYNATTGVKLTTTASTKENGQNVSEVIVRANATVINDGAFTCPVSYTPESVTFTRSIVMDGGKYSFIVPFDIPAAKAATLGKFYKFEKYENDVVYFIEETDVKANTAYFFDPASSITSISLNNAEVKATTSMVDASNPSGYGLYGTYKKIAVPEGAYGYATSAEGDKFVRAGTGSYVNAFRCYLWLGNSDSAPAKANAIFGMGEATGINATKADYLDLNAPMYNLRGQRVTSPQKGEIYIMGGKKVIFK